MTLLSKCLNVHGAPVHMGDPKEVGVDDVMKPDYGEAVDIYEGEIPVFWPCGVTPQAAIENAKPPIVITHAPGHMFITDIPNAELNDYLKQKRNNQKAAETMEFTFPNYYKEFSCISGSCPDTCCAGWQIVIDNKTLKKYQHFKGPFHNDCTNDIDWKEHVFRQYNRRCAFLNEENLCDIYTEAGPKMLCDTCRNYPRHIEEFEGLREISLSLSCPEAARILLSQKEKVHFVTIEKETAEETYDDFNYFLFTALMDTRDLLIKIIQNRNVPIRKRLWKDTCHHT